MVITFDDEVYDMVLLGKFHADCWVALSLGSLSPESVLVVRLAVVILVTLTLQTCTPVAQSSSAPPSLSTGTLAITQPMQARRL